MPSPKKNSLVLQQAVKWLYFRTSPSPTMYDSEDEGSEDVYVSLTVPSRPHNVYSSLVGIDSYTKLDPSSWTRDRG